VESENAAITMSETKCSLPIQHRAR